jgi:hypothetical protein
MSRLVSVCTTCGRVFYTDGGHFCRGPRRATQSAPVRHGRASTRATRYPNLSEKDESVIHIMPHLGAFWRQRRADRIDAARRLARVELDLHCLHKQVLRNSVILGTTPAPAPRAPEPAYGPPAGHPEAESLPLGAEDDVALAGLSLDLWPNDEYGQITADGA